MQYDGDAAVRDRRSGRPAEHLLQLDREYRRLDAVVLESDFGA